MNQVLPIARHEGLDSGSSPVVPSKSRAAVSSRGPSLERSVVDLYQVVDALRAGDRAFVLQFIAPHAGAGTSTLASGFAAAAASVSRRPVLYIDVAARAQADDERLDLLTAFRGLLPLAAATVPARGGSNLLWARLGSGDPAQPMSGEEIRQLLDSLRELHPVVVLDCPALEESPQATALARHCDGTVLVVAAERSSRAQVVAARQEIERVGGQIIGAAFNRQKTYLPRWLQRQP